MRNNPGSFFQRREDSSVSRILENAVCVVITYVWSESGTLPSFPRLPDGPDSGHDPRRAWPEPCRRRAHEVGARVHLPAAVPVHRVADEGGQGAVPMELGGRGEII